jgi:hypothetical protein
MLTLYTPFGYAVNMTRRRLQFSFLACLLALLVASASALPSSMLWQCHHAAQIVVAPFAPQAGAMPCRMSDGPMLKMACCRPARMAAERPSSLKQSLSRLPCQPTLTRLGALPTAIAARSQASLGQRLLTAQATLPPLWSCLPPVPITLSLRQRPPPTVGSSQSALHHAPGLRAPPAA